MNLPLYQPDAENSTRFLFFTGKGGVGKTSLSCATALKLAGAGRRVLLVSTDPASNLDEVLESDQLHHGMKIKPIAEAGVFLKATSSLIGPARYQAAKTSQNSGCSGIMSTT